MIIVTGATGQLGSRVVERLLERLPAQTVGVSVTDAARASHLADRGVRVRTGDFTVPASLDHAFEGADQVLVVSPAIRGPRAAAASAVAVDAALRAGAKRVLYTSHQCAGPDSLFDPGRQHAAAEANLAARAGEHGIGWTALRHGFYASTLAYYVPAALETGELRLPADGPVSWTAHDDLAAADVAALTEPGLDGATAPLAAPEAIDFADVARVVSDLSGRTVRHVVVDDEEWKAGAVAEGMPEAAAEFTLGMFRAARAGQLAADDSVLESVIGRRPITVRTALEGILRGAQITR